MPTVTMIPAEPYRDTELWSTGKASGMLVRQWKFPHVYDARERYISEDHDRLLEFHREHVRACLKKYQTGGPNNIGSWARWHDDDEEIFRFIKEVTKADPKTAWTGYRILGTISRGNGCVAWSLQLFVKLPDSKTEVYSGDEAPNVLPGMRYER